MGLAAGGDHQSPLPLLPELDPDPDGALQLSPLLPLLPELSVHEGQVHSFA